MLPAERRQSILREIEQRGGVTVVDIAERLGVSGMTIRRDLLDLEREGRVTRVHGGAVRYEPRTSRGSSSARRVPTSTIGLIVPSATYYFPGFIAGAKAVAAEEGVRLVLAVSNYEADIEQQQIARLVQLGVQGLIVTPGGFEGSYEESYRLLAGVPIPVVIMERSLAAVPDGLQLGGVRSDHSHGAALAVHHLVDQGRTRIALVAARSGTTADPVHAGYRKAMSERLPDAPPLEFELEGVLGTPEQRRSYEQILQDCLDAGVDAVLVLPDAVAIAMTDLATDQGIHVPQDLAVVAYDDEIASLAALPLTAVSPPKFDVGATAMRMCVDLIQQRARAGRLPAQAQVTLLPSLELRDSS